MDYEKRGYAEVPPAVMQALVTVALRTDMGAAIVAAWRIGAQVPDDLPAELIVDKPGVLRLKHATDMVTDDRGR